MESALYKLLNKKKPQILSKWQPVALSYANNAPVIAQKNKGRFSDPMSYVIIKNTEEILNWVIKAEKNMDLVIPLDEICKIKAIQDLKPREALSFIFFLKQIIREEIEDQSKINDWAVELWELDKRIDEVGLLAFDIYSECRTRIYDLRVNEIKRMYGRDEG